MIRKVICSFLFILLILNLSLPLTSRSFANTYPSLSDALYADLAIHHALDNVSLNYYQYQPSQTLLINDSRQWLPASTVKTYVAMYAFNQISHGELSLKQNVIIDAKNEVPTELVTDDYPTLLTGQSVTLERLIKQMIIQSDNTAFNQLLDLLGREKVTSYIQSLGLSNSHVGSKLNLDDSQQQYELDTTGYGINTTTADDYTKAFHLMQNNKIPGAKQLIEILREQRINNMIPLYLPKYVVCAHKTGDLNPLYHDGGICFDKKREYILSIFTNAGDPDLLAHLSQIIYTGDFNLVGINTSKKSISENSIHPIDPLVFAEPQKENVLAASTTNFPVPSITAADLGISSGDLSLVISKDKLPPVFIPLDSPFHAFIDEAVVLRRLLAFTPEQKMAIDISDAKLRLAEANELLTRNKKNLANAALDSVNTGLKVISQDPTLSNNLSEQAEIKAVSETRFSLLGEEVTSTKGVDKLELIKQIADQARTTKQIIEPKIPQALDSTNPSQKPLVGQVVSSTNNSVTIKTSGGQQITIPTDQVKIETKTANKTSSSPTQPVSPSSVPTISNKVPGNFPPGSTIAIIGSNVQEKFVPALIVKNIPKEIAAPEPVTVAKVDTKNKTMVIIENGIYNQVNINPDTVIKGADTNITLSSIKPGDVVVVRGEPLNTILATPTPSISQTPQPTVPLTKSPPQTILKTQSANSSITIIPTISPKVSVFMTPTIFITPATSTNQSPTQGPKIIEAKTVQVLEKKADMTNLPSKSHHAPTSKPSTQSHHAPTSKPSTQSQPAPTSKPSTQSQPAPTSKPSTQSQPAPTSKPSH